MHVGQFIDQLLAEGRYCFTAEEALNTFGPTVVATRAALADTFVKLKEYKIIFVSLFIGMI